MPPHPAPHALARPATRHVSGCTWARGWVPALTLLLSAAGSALAGCAKPTPEQVADGDDPLAALAVPATTRRYTETYWQEQYRADSAGRSSPWKQALAYCGTSDAPRPGLNADGNKPNCGAVFYVEDRTPAATARYEARRKTALEQLQQKLDAQLREAQARAGRF